MAGIGFKLRRWVQEDGLQGLVLGYFSSAVLAAGPWLISIATLSFLSRAWQGESTLLSSLVITINLLSLLATGPFQFALTRYLADRLYAADVQSHLAAFVTCWTVGVAPPTALFGLLLLLSPLSPAWRLQALSLFGLTCSLWMLLLFLGVVRAYRVILAAFIAGNLVSAAASVALGRLAPDPQLGQLAGYTLGQAVLTAMLLGVLVMEFPWSGVGWDPQALTALRRYPALTAGGFLYYFALSADKLVMRLFSSRPNLTGIAWLQANPDYERAAFLAQLTVLPALAIFFLAVETEFFERFRQFFSEISQGRTLYQIGQSRQRMLASLRSGALRLALHQGVVTTVAVLLAAHWLPAPLVGLGQVQMVGVYFQTMLYFSTVVMLYYELYREALAGILVFAAGNLLFTLLWPSTGWGFVLAALAASLVSWLTVARALPQVERLVFERQPLQLQEARLGAGVYTYGEAS